MFNTPSPACSRRHVVRSLMSGSLLLPAAMSELLADGPPPHTFSDPMAPRPPHLPGKAKQVIWLFMTGGVSHLESFDPKPKLAADGGKLYRGRTLLAPQFKYSRGG